MKFCADGARENVSRFLRIVEGRSKHGKYDGICW
jgi:hypothetical protein